VTNTGRHGFGMAVRAGLEHCSGDAIAVMMADDSDDPEDLVVYYRKLQEGYECGLRLAFYPRGRVVDYPWHKLILNRNGEYAHRLIFAISYNDVYECL